MKKLRNIAIGFFLVNCLSLVVFACAGGVTYNGQYCSFTGGLNGYCRYLCPDNTVIEITCGESGDCEGGG
jgi:uncharacterized membrane protein